MFTLNEIHVQLVFCDILTHLPHNIQHIYSWIWILWEHQKWKSWHSYGSQARKIPREGDNEGSVGDGNCGHTHIPAEPGLWWQRFRRSEHKSSAVQLPILLHDEERWAASNCSQSVAPALPGCGNSGSLYRQLPIWRVFLKKERKILTQKQLFINSVDVPLCSIKNILLVYTLTYNDIAKVIDC